MSDTVLTDILGQEIQPGDTVIYPQMSGRSVQIVLAEFLNYNGKTAQLVRKEGTRWKAEHRGAGYYDMRTGRKLNVYGDKLWPQFVQWKKTGFPGWVEERKEPKRSVTIRNTGNIVKVQYAD